MRARSGSTAPLDEAQPPSAAAAPGRHAATSPRPPTAERALRWAAIGVPALVLMGAGWVRRWTTDDGFINYRVVHMLVGGHGPVFNVGERVEATTSPLWTGVLAVGDLLLPMRLEYVGIALSLPLAGLGLVAMGSGSRRLWEQPQDRWWLPLGSVVVLALSPVWDFTTSGLETSLTIAWLGGLVWVLGRWCTGSRPLTTVEAMIVGLGPLVRPDTALYSGAVLALVVLVRWREERWSDRLRVVGVAFALPVLYELFRMAYFAALVPNTVLAKGADFAHWQQGWAYLRNFVGTYQLLVPLVLLVVAAVLLARQAPARNRLALAVLPATACLHALVVVRAGGDYMHARLLLPALVAIAAPIAVVPARRALLVPVAAVAVWAVVAATSLRMGEAVKTGPSLIADGRQAITGFLDLDNPITAEQTDAATVKAYRTMTDGVWNDRTRTAIVPGPGVPTPLAFAFGIGVGGFAGGDEVQLLDRLGLADAITARLQVDEPGFIGHEKPLPDAWLAARITDRPVPPDSLGKGLFSVPLYESPAGQLDADAAAAREALQCGDLKELRDAISSSLTPGRAAENMWRSFGLTRLKVPPDPNVARDALC